MTQRERSGMPMFWALGFVCVLGWVNPLAADANADRLGKKIPKVNLHNTQGKSVSLQELRGKKGTVVVFLSFECPVSRDYCQPLTELSRSLPELAVVGICGDREMTAAQLAKHVQEFKIPFPVLLDEHQLAVDALKAEITPEAFLLDADFVLRYRGRIDNSYAARLRKNRQTTKRDLQQAISELLAGKPISEPTTQAIGCSIVRDRTVKAETAKVTYYRDVLPIVQQHCQGCHRPGEVGPFPLMTYSQAVNWASDIKDYTQTRRMPPWKPTEGLPFHDERKISDKDISTLAAWVDGATPEGDPKDAPPPRQFASGWQIGTPDLVLTVPEEFTLGGNGRDVFRCFVLPTNLTEDKYVSAVEIRPGNPRIVHHTLLAIDLSGGARKLDEKERNRPKKEDEADFGPGYNVAMGFGIVPQGNLSGWAPGQMPRRLPEGIGYMLPKGSDVVMQVHYHRDGKQEKDRCQVGIYFSDKPVKKRMQSMVLAGSQGGILGRTWFSIPAGKDSFRLDGKMWIDQDVTVYSVLPHMHMIGKSIQVTMTPPGGAKQTLVDLGEWDYNWQETYFFKKPLNLKAGTLFEVHAVYDNSDKNPNNPRTPPQRVNFGQETTDEMCFVFLGSTSDTPGRIRPRFTPLPAENSPKR